MKTGWMNGWRLGRSKLGKALGKANAAAGVWEKAGRTNRCSGLPTRFRLLGVRVPLRVRQPLSFGDRRPTPDTHMPRDVSIVSDLKTAAVLAGSAGLLGAATVPFLLPSIFEL